MKNHIKNQQLKWDISRSTHKIKDDQKDIRNLSSIVMKQSQNQRYNMVDEIKSRDFTLFISFYMRFSIQLPSLVKPTDDAFAYLDLNLSLKMIRIDELKKKKDSQKRIQAIAYKNSIKQDNDSYKLLQRPIIFPQLNEKSELKKKKIIHEFRIKQYDEELSLLEKLVQAQKNLETNQSDKK